jgi:hypothetical protein
MKIHISIIPSDIVSITILIYKHLEPRSLIMKFYLKYLLVFISCAILYSCSAYSEKGAENNKESASVVFQDSSYFIPDRKSPENLTNEKYQSRLNNDSEFLKFTKIKSGIDLERFTKNSDDDMVTALLVMMLVAVVLTFFIISGL